MIQWQSEHPDVSVGDVFLIAPAFGDSLAPDAPYDEPLLNGFFEFIPDSKLIDRVKSLHLIFSDNDSIRVDRSVELIQKTYPDIKQYTFSGRGHFLSDSFIELLDLIDDSIRI